MRKALAFLITVLALPSLAVAGEVEIGGFAGYTFPFYSQTFKYDPGPVTVVDFPDLTIQQSGTFDLKASVVRLRRNGGVLPHRLGGFELRLDSANLTVKTQSPTYHVHATLPVWPAPVDRNLSLETGQASLSAANAFSLNLKLRSRARRVSTSPAAPATCPTSASRCSSRWCSASRRSTW